MADDSQRGQKSVGPLPLEVLGRQVRAPDVDGVAEAEAHRHQGPCGQGRHGSMFQVHFYRGVLFRFLFVCYASSLNQV